MSNISRTQEAKQEEKNGVKHRATLQRHSGKQVFIWFWNRRAQRKDPPQAPGGSSGVPGKLAHEDIWGNRSLEHSVWKTPRQVFSKFEERWNTDGLNTHNAQNQPLLPRLNETSTHHAHKFVLWGLLVEAAVCSIVTSGDPFPKVTTDPHHLHMQPARHLARRNSTHFVQICPFFCFRVKWVG